MCDKSWYVRLRTPKGKAATAFRLPCLLTYAIRDIVVFSSSLLCPARAQADELATSGIQATEHSYEDVILLHHALRRRYPHDKVCR